LLDDDVAAVEGRITDALLPLTRAWGAGRTLVPPPPYVRRHVVEHAAAGGVLDGRLLAESFLPDNTAVATAYGGRGFTSCARYDELPCEGPNADWRSGFDRVGAGVVRGSR